MITARDIQKRVFNFLDKIYLNNRLSFYFDNDINQCYITGKQTDAPRPSATSLIFYNISEPEPFGCMIASDTPYLNRYNGREEIQIWRSVQVTIDVVSKVKGAAKDATNFMIAMCHSHRKDDACYIKTGATGFNFALYNMDKSIDLTELENRAWTERIQTNLYFNYQDTISTEQLPLIKSASSVESVKDIININLEPK